MNLERSILTWRAILCLLATATASVGADAFPRLIADPEIAAVGQMAEPLPVDTFIRIALRVSGVPVGELKSLSAVVWQLVADAESRMSEDMGSAALAEWLLQYLHENTFTLYDEFQTRIDVAATSGRFNCVSSAILYMILAKHFGIPVIGVGTADHAFCSVSLQDRSVDVETTTIYGFDPGSKKEFQDAFGNVTGYSYVPPSSYARRDKLGERELLALVLQNRISYLEGRTEYGAAVALAVDRYALAPNDLTRSQLAREMVNFAALLNERKQYAVAIEFLSKGAETYGWDESYRAIFEILHFNDAVALIQANRPREAIDAVERASALGRIGEVPARNLRRQAAEAVLSRELPSLSAEEGIELVNQLFSEGLVSPARHLDFSVMLFSTLADTHAQAGGYLRAAEVIDGAIAVLGADTRLAQARSTYRYNYAVEAHNAFASRYNEARYRDALEHLLNALELVPESRILADDLTTVRRAIAAEG
jgi:tetratricopeptide (TPR) repeat protein